MKKTITQKILYPNEAENLRTRVVGKEVEVSYEIQVEEPQSQEVSPEETKGTKEWLDKYFPVVHASSLSLDDEILKYKPKTEKQKDFKERLIEAIKSGLQDFRAPIMDPSFDEYGNIFYKAGVIAGVGASPIWWEKNAKEFLPEKESRLGFTEERIAFLALLIKELIEEYNYTISNAWRWICDEEKYLGYRINSEEAEYPFKHIGSRKLGRWYDLEKTSKITKNKAGGFSYVGGYYYSYCYGYPLADVFWEGDPNWNSLIGVGWVVLSV